MSRTAPPPTPNAPEASAPWPLYRDRRNVVELPYRGVSVQPYDGEMTAAAIADHLQGREAYRRTNVVVLRGAGGAYALAAIARRDRESLFAPIEHVEVLALPDSCVFVSDPDTDCANRSALARLADRCGVGVDGTLICQGKYDHVNFIHRPDPLVIRVVEVAPPEPPKLFHLIEHVLSYADLPPIRLELERIELRQLAATVRPFSHRISRVVLGGKRRNSPFLPHQHLPRGRPVGSRHQRPFHRHTL